MIAGSNSYAEIDLADYAPPAGIKNFTTVSYYPQSGEHLASVVEKITVQGNVFYIDESEAIDDEPYISYTITIYDEEIHAKYPYYDAPQVIKRYVDIGDETLNWVDPPEGGVNRQSMQCTLVDRLTSFSHGGYSYQGDILKEKCLHESFYSYSIGNGETVTQEFAYYYSYSKKGVGGIALIADMCIDTKGNLHITEGCIPNAYTYNYYEVTATPTPTFTLDIDGDGSVTPLTDGLLILRYQFGFRGDALINNAISSAATRQSATEIEGILAKGSTYLDVDGNGSVTPLTDGLLLLRYLFGFRDDALINNAVGDGATRTNGEKLGLYINTYIN